MRQTEFELRSISPVGRSLAVHFEPDEVNPVLEERGYKIERLTEPLVGEFTLTRSSGMVSIEGTLKTVMHLGCVRCLVGFQDVVETRFILLVKGPSHGEEPTHGEVELAPDDLEVEQLRDERIRLDEVAIEQLTLALPGYPLCFDDCKGLCPGCGENLNEAECSCKAKPVDPRLAALANFKPKK